MQSLLLGPVSGSLSRTADIGLLILRVFAGLALAFGHGMGKMPPSERFVERVSAMGFPGGELFAWLAALAEVVGGFLIALGLLTRPVAVFVACHMAIVAAVAHANDPFSGKEKALLFLAIFISFAFTGAGRNSLDALVFGRRAATR